MVRTKNTRQSVKTKKSVARYGGRFSREVGSVRKDWGGRLPIALIYPNSYYLGMSNLGIHVIYGLLNSYSKVVCERVFWEDENRDKNLPPLSLESQRPLSDFAVLAFSISYELDYFNVVKILKASGIPLYAADRDERHPLVIAGGPCISANPMPLAPFFDCSCIGEAEAILPTMLPLLSEVSSGKREELLESLASVPGVYVPEYSAGNPVLRQWVRNLDDYPATTVILTPDTELGKLYLIEIERGCNWGCRFCLVGSTFSPMRFRSVDKLLEQAKQGLEYRKRIGLVGPAVSDHPQIEELLTGLRRMGAELSISSLRVNSLSNEILSDVAGGKAQTVALAPEAGSQRLRQIIRKGISEDDILRAISMIAGQTIKQLKLYFMIGLPTETDEDIEEIIRLTLSAKDILDKQKSGTRITLNVAPFVPKASTPFQWLPMTPLKIINIRMSRLKRALSPKGIKTKCESPAWSQVQGVLARGDTGLSDVLAGIEEVSLAGWRQAMDKYQLDTGIYVNRRWPTDQELPWAIIDSGIKTDYLKRELNKALA